jgi:hypothetical protein
MKAETIAVLSQMLAFAEGPQADALADALLAQTEIERLKERIEDLEGEILARGERDE